MKRLSWIKWAVLLIVAVAACILVWNYHHSPETPVTAGMTEARILDLRPMVRLSSVEIYEEVPVHGRIGKKHIFAKETLNGTISFDLEHARQEWRGDTLMIVLPPEIIDIYESTEPGSYEVIDTWNDSWTGSSNFTTEEENAVKRKAKEQWKKVLYNRGHVRRARAEAVTNLGTMLAPLVKGEVIVIDPMPEGNPASADTPSTDPNECADLLRPATSSTSSTPSSGKDSGKDKKDGSAGEK